MISQTATTLKQVNDLIARESNMERRNMAKQEYKSLNAKFTVLKAQYDALRESKLEHERSFKRQQIVQTGFKNPNERSHHSYDNHLKEASVLDMGRERVDDFIQMGQQALDALKVQRSTFKSLERRALDAAQRLGVSDSVMKVIKGRTAGDRLIFRVSCLIVVVLLLWILYKRLF